MSFADKIKFVRAQLLISQKELANLIGVNYVTISRWETGKLQPSFLTEKKFEKFCNNKKIKWIDQNKTVNKI